MTLATGKFSERVTLEARSATRAPNGEELLSWAPIATVWARVEPLRGREWFAGGQMQSAVDYRITIRYRSGITREQRIVWQGLPLDVVSVIDVNARRETLELMCISGVRNG